MSTVMKQEPAGLAGGLTAAEWQEFARVIWTWPELGICNHSDAQAMITKANDLAKQAKEREITGIDQ